MTRPRVAVTTTPDRFDRLAGRLRRLGLEPVGLACIEVIAASGDVLGQARERAGSADWLVMTSARAVEVLWPHGGMPMIPAAAVGPSTAAAVSAAGGLLEMVGDRGATALARHLGKVASGRTVFFPHASGAGTAIADALTAVGAVVDAAPVYETRPIPPGDSHVDAVMFGSPSAVDGWLLSRELDGLVVAVIGETTAAALAGKGRAPDVLARRPSFDLLSRSIAEHFREGSSV